MRGTPYHNAMRPIYWLPFSSVLILMLLNGCANNSGSAGNDSLGTGPFDSAGNYREEWANDPSKWRKPGSRTPQPATGDNLPVIAKHEEPPPNANPLAPAGASNPKTSSTRVKPLPPVAAHRTEAPTTRSSKTTPSVVKVRPESTASVAKTSQKSRSSVAKTKTKAKPSVAKAKAKTKPTSQRYIVKKGDSLSAIASRNHSSVSAIRKANGISGTMIHPGDKLVIPKR